MKYVNYDKTTNKILGYYDDQIHTTIPTPNFQISDEIWQEAIDKNANKVDAKTKTLFFEAKEPTLEDIKAKFLSDVDALLNQKAHEKGYDNIATAASYAAMPNPFYEEGVAFFKWRSEVYTYCYGILEKVQKGELAITDENIAKVMQDMPKLELPEASTQTEASNGQGE
ncbi:hypothetical protein CCAL9344_07920 [Campylobacter sp. RM9344]|uniref:Uncharacterized protein n=1 Tax=Campylobacter californiensis TaxID=1032243 RepID=A0AAW3ZV71_9BACT|nr:hypothetical protein [Campylobacter sp. RM9337]MBE3030104.1 hypothetical protein [Campylobacter sp. RM9344]MBE3608777.1 hypothetical protein [Campylobacter sp. RM9337]